MKNADIKPGNQVWYRPNNTAWHLATVLTKPEPSGSMGVNWTCEISFDDKKRWVGTHRLFDHEEKARIQGIYDTYCRSECGALARRIGNDLCVWVSRVGKDKKVIVGPVGADEPEPDLDHLHVSNEALDVAIAVMRYRCAQTCNEVPK